MMKKLLIILLVPLALAGCGSSLPQNGSTLNQKVGEGIQKNQVEVEKIIMALADVERSILDQEWDNVYLKVEGAYMAKNAVPSAALLSQDQHQAVAADAAKTYYSLRGKITAIERTLIAQTQSNSKTLLEINDEVTKYLLSVQELDSAADNIDEKLESLVGINLSGISGLAKSLIGGI